MCKDHELYLYLTVFYDNWVPIMEELEHLEVSTFGMLALKRFN